MGASECGWQVRAAARRLRARHTAEACTAKQRRAQPCANEAGYGIARGRSVGGRGRAEAGKGMRPREAAAGAEADKPGRARHRERARARARASEAGASEGARVLLSHKTLALLSHKTLAQRGERAASRA